MIQEHQPVRMCASVSSSEGWVTIDHTLWIVTIIKCCPTLTKCQMLTMIEQMLTIIYQMLTIIDQMFTKLTKFCLCWPYLWCRSVPVRWRGPAVLARGGGGPPPAWRGGGELWLQVGIVPGSYLVIALMMSGTTVRWPTSSSVSSENLYKNRSWCH